MFQGSVKLCFITQNIVQDSNRVMASSGTVRAPDKALHQPYADDAYIPNEPWQFLSTSEAAQLISDQFQVNGSNIGVFRLPEKQYQQFKQIDCTAIEAISSIRAFNETLENRMLATGILGHVREMGIISSFDKVGFEKNLPNSLTVTYYRKKSHFVGLHFDNHDKFSVLDRHLSRNRICINMGCESRYFLFIDLQIAEIVEKLMLHGVTCNYTTADAIGTCFLQSFPDYPVIKLRLDPGEAYIAPVDNILHDGSTAGTSAADFCLSAVCYG
jgi:hypothetical protein